MKPHSRQNNVESKAQRLKRETQRLLQIKVTYEN